MGEGVKAFNELKVNCELSNYDINLHSNEKRNGSFKKHLEALRDHLNRFGIREEEKKGKFMRFFFVLLETLARFNPIILVSISTLISRESDLQGN